MCASGILRRVVVLALRSCNCGRPRRGLVRVLRGGCNGVSDLTRRCDARGTRGFGAKAEASPLGRTAAGGLLLAGGRGAPLDEDVAPYPPPLGLLRRAACSSSPPDHILGEVDRGDVIGTSVSGKDGGSPALFDECSRAEAVGFGVRVWFGKVGELAPLPRPGVGGGYTIGGKL